MIITATIITTLMLQFTNGQFDPIFFANNNDFNSLFSQIPPQWYLMPERNNIGFMNRQQQLFPDSIGLPFQSTLPFGNGNMLRQSALQLMPPMCHPPSIPLTVDQIESMIESFFSAPIAEQKSMMRDLLANIGRSSSSSTTTQSSSKTPEQAERDQLLMNDFIGDMKKKQFGNIDVVHSLSKLWGDVDRHSSGKSKMIPQKLF